MIMRRIDTDTSFRHQVIDMLMRFCVSVCKLMCASERETGEESRSIKEKKRKERKEKEKKHQKLILVPLGIELRNSDFSGVFLGLGHSVIL